MDRRFLILLCLAIHLPPVSMFGSPARAQEAPPTAPAGEQPSSPPGSIPDQEQNDPIEPIQRAVPRTAAEQARVDALSWFGVARVLQARGDLKGAFEAYRRAVESDGEVLAIYRQLIPLALHLNQTEDALRWVGKAARLDPNDFQWLVQLAELQIRSDDLPGAIDSLERATRLPTLDPKSTPMVVLKHQLAQWYVAAQRFADAARVLEPVFDAVLHPEDYKLSAPARTQILGNLSLEKFGEVFLEGDRPDLALQAFRKAVEKRGSPTGDLSFLLASAHLKNNEPEPALAELQKYLDAQRQSKRQGAYDLLAEVLKSLGRSDEMIPRLEAAAAKDPRNPYLQLALADQYAQADRLDQAEALFKKTLAISADARGFAGLARVYRRRNRPQELLGALASSYGEAGNLQLVDREIKAILADKGLLSAVLNMGREQLQREPGKLKYPAGYVLAHLAAEARETDMAVDFYRFLLRIRGDKRGAIYEELGKRLLDVHRYAQAADLFQEAAESSAGAEERSGYLYSRTYALTLQGNAEEALRVIQQLIDQNDRNPGYLFRQAWILGHARRFEESIAAYEKLLAMFPNAALVQRLGRSGLSNVYVARGDVRRGEEILEEVYRENPDDISVNNDLGYLYADQGKNLEQAERMIRKAVEAEPENGAYIDSLGWVLFRLGRPEEALPLIQQAIEKGQGTGDETLHDHLGDVLDRLGKPAEALQSWKRALEMSRQTPYQDPQLIERIQRKIEARESRGPKPAPTAPNAP